MTTTLADDADNAHEQAPPVNWKHLKCYGYAPGNYMSTCFMCRRVVSGLDKRAIRCRPCAEEMLKRDRIRKQP